ncbi:aminotransferase class I/II-fold pyridoxal phosphate-dependent enzyme [Patescibacteria group bacterium]|nr:aminotransferase class I/II-fold pyridoxal phosphate-dependent enzyme [Patescibacteria group bacterium]
MNTTNETWRSRFAERIGGREFDTPGGGYSFSAVLAEERELEKANNPGRPESALLKLSVADPTWKMPETAWEVGEEYFYEAWDASRYKDIAGTRATPGTIMQGDTHAMLAELIHARHQVALPGGRSLTPEWIQYSPGSIKRALAEYIPTLLLGDGTTLLFPSPSYQVIASPMNRRVAILIDVPLVRLSGQWSFDADKLTDIVRGRPGPRPVVYVNIPHNPTGRGYTKSDWEFLIGWACQYGVTLVVDEAYIDLRYLDDLVSVLSVPGWEECCIVLQSVSKGWNATGLRFGWIAAHPTVIKALRKVMDVKDSGMFGPSIVSGLSCLRYPEFAEETRRRYLVLHEKLASGLREAGFQGHVPDAGLCQFTPSPKSITASPEGVIFQDAADCAKFLRDYLRISVMHAEAAGGQWLRWAVTLRPVPECGLASEEAVIDETVRRLKSVKFVF